ncbi:MAG: hypothetical protein DRH04_03250 [Deltaproteobacteria bacterium]|nr:MAG: hypothetical protein DRH04_03250 [Deltaproteobacteria bacterium]
MKIEQFIVDGSETIRVALQKMNEGGQGFIAVYREVKVYGIITDGDVRRAILQGVDLGEEVSSIANTRFRYLEAFDRQKVEEIFAHTPVRHLPIIQEGRLVEVIFEEAFFLEEGESGNQQAVLDVPLVIMAGGRGTRLYPYTKVLPKALVPVHGRPIIEMIIDRFKEYAVNSVFISVNHKAGMIRAYFEDVQQEDIGIHFFQEDHPLGTAGALRLMKTSLDRDFFLSNCDILVKTDYREVLDFHRQNYFAITIVGALIHHRMPYGVCRIENGGTLIDLVEKQEHDYLVNTGMYVVSPRVLPLIPEGVALDMNELISLVQSAGQRVGVFPIPQNAWLDIGQLDNYNHLLEKE